MRLFFTALLTLASLVTMPGLLQSEDSITIQDRFLSECVANLFKAIEQTDQDEIDLHVYCVTRALSRSELLYGKERSERFKLAIKTRLKVLAEENSEIIFEGNEKEVLDYRITLPLELSALSKRSR